MIQPRPYRFKQYSQIDTCIVVDDKVVIVGSDQQFNPVIDVLNSNLQNTLSIDKSLHNKHHTSFDNLLGCCVDKQLRYYRINSDGLSLQRQIDIEERMKTNNFYQIRQNMLIIIDFDEKQVEIVDWLGNTRRIIKKAKFNNFVTHPLSDSFIGSSMNSSTVFDVQSLFEIKRIEAGDSKYLSKNTIIGGCYSTRQLLVYDMRVQKRVLSIPISQHTRAFATNQENLVVSAFPSSVRVQDIRKILKDPEAHQRQTLEANIITLQFIDHKTAIGASDDYCMYSIDCSRVMEKEAIHFGI